MRRMRLHQKIAAALEAEPGADDEMLAELAHHYFECAWAGNAAKAVDYCRRAADQAMTRLAYEGAADLYDKALHALEELDDEVADRGDQQAELLIARCEALLAAGDVASATGAVAQLVSAAADSVRLAAWGACFDGQLAMLTEPERLNEIEVAVGAAAEQLAALEDAGGEAKAHTVRAGCLARLGRIEDCETALDQALTAARRARDHRRVNAVLAGAPLAALWGPNPVPRAGGRCLDVVRLLRITTGSPVVEATSTRCQGVLDAFRGRAAAGRQLIDSARRTLDRVGHAARTSRSRSVRRHPGAGRRRSSGRRATPATGVQGLSSHGTRLGHRRDRRVARASLHGTRQRRSKPTNYARRVSISPVMR